MAPDRAGVEIVAGSPRALRSRLIRSVDRFLRRTDTWPAMTLARVSPRGGATYTTSNTKRMLDLAISLPAALFVILIVGILLAVNKLLYPADPALFVQDRVGGHEEPVRVLKIRSLVSAHGNSVGGVRQPSCTSFGRFMRRHYLDELPQLLQVLTGRLSLVGTRVLPVDVYDGLSTSWSPRRLQSWRAMYASIPLGLTGPHQILRRAGKEDARRYHRDMFYARHASLGFDLYLLWRTIGARDNDHGISRSHIRHHF